MSDEQAVRTILASALSGSMFLILIYVTIRYIGNMEKAIREKKEQQKIKEYVDSIIAGQRNRRKTLTPCVVWKVVPHPVRYIRFYDEVGSSISPAPLKPSIKSTQG